MRRLSPLDRAVARLDGALRAATLTGLEQRRPSPGAAAPDPPLPAAERRHAAGLMRVNHTGEVCAQALYAGQAALARDDAAAAHLRTAAAEEGDHLHWCRERLAELDSRPSLLNPLWFAGSFAIGLGAAALGDRWSMGFVEETERQVVRHLDGHLAALPEHDARSRAIVQAMRADEARHADAARRRGAGRLPWPLRALMKAQARVMTRVAYRL